LLAENASPPPRTAPTEAATPTPNFLPVSILHPYLGHKMRIDAIMIREKDCLDGKRNAHSHPHPSPNGLEDA
jgi:hypothetical protein